MKSPSNKQNGIIAVLDALGASNYSDADIQVFLKSRENIMTLLEEKIEEMSDRIDRNDIDIFTFNDTILIAYKTNYLEPSLRQIGPFFNILRKFFVDSLSHKILFRGSVAIGTFYVDNKTNTVLGQAVSDAAAWYEKADWAGIHATPKATIIIQRWLERRSALQEHLMLDYDVPLKDGKFIRVKSVNWPKVFFIESLSPCRIGEKEREKLLQMLSEHSVPLGTEHKFFNTIDFFDHAVKIINKGKKRTSGST